MTFCISLFKLDFHGAKKRIIKTAHPKVHLILIWLAFNHSADPTIIVESCTRSREFNFSTCHALAVYSDGPLT